jgi:hypothetical protein
VWVGHSLRLRSGQALSDAVDFDFESDSGIPVATNEVAVEKDHNPQTNFKGVGQKRPTHTKIKIHTQCSVGLGISSSVIQNSVMRLQRACHLDRGLEGTRC